MFKGKLREFQKEMALFMINKKRVINGSETGLGKTIEALACAEKLREMGLIDKCLVVCLKSLKTQWERKIQDFTDSKYVLIEGGREKRDELYKKAMKDKYFYVIINYEQTHKHASDLWKMLDEVDRSRIAIVCDEVTKIKNWRTKTAKRIKTLWSKWMWALTATPVENRPDEIFSIVEWLNRDFFGSFWKFDKRYIVRNPFGGVQYYRNLQELNQKISPLLLKHTRKEVQDQLPKLIFKQYDTILSPEEKRLYNSIRKDLLEDLDLIKEARSIDLSTLTSDDMDEIQKELEEGVEKTQFQILSKFMALRQVCIHPQLLSRSTSQYAKDKYREFPIMGSSKQALLLEVVETLLREPGSKIVIFSFFVKMLEYIEASIKELFGVKVAMFTGNTNSKDRLAAQDAFNTDKDTRIILCSDAGGYGIDLPGGNYLINCVQGDQRVWFEDGRRIPIKRVVNQKIQGKVLSYNMNRDKYEYKSIIGWHNNGKLGECLEIKTESGNILRVTPEHLVNTSRGWVRADSLTLKDSILTTEVLLTELQKDLIYGSLLGDMGIYRNGKNYLPDLREGHCQKQKKYVDWKCSILKGFVTKRWFYNTKWGKVYCFRTRASGQLLDIHNKVKVNEKKYVSLVWLKELTPFSLAVWYMDDGTLKKLVPYICIAGLTLKEKKFTKHTLKFKFGLNTRFSRNRNDIAMLPGEDSRRFQTIISGYVPNCMQYKLNKEFQGRYRGLLDREEGYYFSRVKEINDWKRFGNKNYTDGRVSGRKHRRGHKFCLSIKDNHNFVSNGLVISNCDLPWHFGKLDQRNRIQRLSSTHKTNVIINLISENTVEERMHEIIEQKRRLSSIIIDGAKGNDDEKSFTMNKQTLRQFLKEKGELR